MNMLCKTIFAKSCTVPGFLFVTYSVIYVKNRYILKTMVYIWRGFIQENDYLFDVLVCALDLPVVISIYRL